MTWTRPEHELAAAVLAALDARLLQDTGFSLPCLAVPDCFAEKLLANSDRWADRHVCARDLVDLAVLRARSGPVPDGTWRRVEQAYGSGVREDLRRAIVQFRELPGFAEGCLRRLAVSDPRLVEQGIERLSHDLA